MSSFTSFVLSISTILSFFAGTSAVPSADDDPQKPALILVPAAFSKATVYDEVKSRLSGVGYEVVAINLPSVGKAAAYVDRTPDIKSLQKVLAQQLHQGKNVVLIGNSYGATVICDAVKDFEDKSSLKSTAPANGKILGLIFFSGFMPYISEPSGGHPDIRKISPSWFRFEGTSRVFWDGDMEKLPPQVTLYNLLGPTTAAVAVDNLEPSSFAALNATAKYIPYDGKFRSLYVTGTQDNAVPLALAKTYLDQPGAKWETIQIDGDHTPQLSRPDKFVSIVRHFAEKKV